MKFRWKLFFSYLLIILIPFVAAEWFIASHLKDRLLQQIEGHLSKDAMLVRTFVEQLADQPLSAEQIDPLIKNMGRDIDARITFIDSKGHVLADTAVPFEELKNLEDHSRRPEFIAAFNNAKGVSIRYSTTLGKEMMYLAVKVQPYDQFLGVARVAVPLTEVRALVSDLGYSLAVVFVISIGLMVFFNIMAARKLARPIEEITKAAEAISAGDFNVRVHAGGKGIELATLGRSVNTMAQEIRKRVREITQEKETLNTILGSMSDGVMVVDNTGKIILVNSVLEALFGSGQASIGIPPVQVIRSAELQDGFSKVLETGKTFRMELSVARPGSDNKIFAVTITRLMPEGKTEGAVAVFHDITDLKRIEKVRKDFVANVSHELRTPLTSIKGYAETICHGKLEDLTKAKSFAEIILKHANRLSTLVEDLLSLTRLEAEKRLPIKREIRLAELFDAALLVVKPAAEAKHLRLEIKNTPEGLRAWADRDQISQALINLLDNAVKYTPDGGSVTLWGKDEGAEIHVTVQDTGIGIPKEDLDRIFERFYRVDKNRSRDMGGTGLGLSIVKHIIQGHGGRVWVQSRVEEGSAFTFSLPKNP